MAERKPVVLVSGQLKEMPSTDFLPAANIPEVTAAHIHAATSKATPVDADELGLSDSAASWGLKKLTFANLKAVLLTYFKGKFREKLTADRTYYVRADGSDSNDGLSNTSGGAFLTIQKAVDVVGALDSSIYGLTISIGAGTYAPFTTKDPLGSGTVSIEGVSKSSVTISTATGPCITVPTGSQKYFVAGLRLTSTDTGSSGNAIYVAIGGSINGSDLDFGPCGNFHINCSGTAIFGSYTISGGARVHWYASNGGKLICAGFTITLTGTPAFSVSFVYGDCLSLLRVNANTFVGSATGVRYSISLNSAIYVNGAGTTYLPGSSLGSAASGGLYA